jgi:cytochrome P450
MFADANLDPHRGVPAHVPEALAWNRDIPAFACEGDDPFLAISRLHDGPDIVWARATSHGQPAWVPTRHALINEICLDPVRFSSRNNGEVTALLDVNWRQNPLDYDPPHHLAYRQALQPWFQPSTINRMDGAIRKIANDLIDVFERTKRCEFVAEFAMLFPSQVFLEMTGMPRNMLPEFYRWEHDFTKSRDPDVRKLGARAILAYLERYAEERRQDVRNDVITGVLEARINDRPLDHGEIMGMLFTLYIGGLDTVKSALGWHLQHLARDQTLQKRLRANPHLIPAAVEEMLRMYGIVATHRTVTRDFVFHGVQMKEGDRVLLPTYLAGRDPRQFERPHEFDLSRKPRHLSFATGIHNCLGAHLARREIAIVFETWLSRLDGIRIAPGEAISFQTEGVWSVTRLPLEWD